MTKEEYAAYYSAMRKLEHYLNEKESMGLIVEVFTWRNTIDTMMDMTGHIWALRKISFKILWPEIKNIHSSLRTEGSHQQRRRGCIRTNIYWGVADDKKNVQ